MKKLRWGLVSTAAINQQIIPAIRASKRGELVAVGSRSEEKAEMYARQWKIPQAFGGYQQMLESGEVDVVYVSLPNHLHAEWSIKAMKAGVHVLCEKPFAITMMEVDAMIATSQETNCVLAEAFMYRHHPQTKLAGEIVQSGKLGEVLFVQGAFGFRLSEKRRQPKTLDVRLKPQFGGGSLWDIGVYPLSFSQFIMGGPPQEVSARQTIGDTGVDETTMGQMVYPNGAFAQIFSSFRVPYYTAMEIVGTKGRLFLTRPFNNMDNNREMTLYSQKGKPQKIHVPHKKLYLGEVEDMHSAILDEKPNYITLAETRNHIRTTLSLYKSAQTGQPIQL